MRALPSRNPSFGREQRRGVGMRSGMAFPPLYQFGGVVERSGMAMVHKGETVAPKSVHLSFMEKRLAGAKRGVSGKAGYRAGPKRQRTKPDFDARFSNK